MEPLSDEEFEAIVEEALASIPERFTSALDNVAIVIEDEPTDYHFGRLDDPDSLGGSFTDTDLLGLYDGINLVDRTSSYGARGPAPDVITIFKGPHERAFPSRDLLVEEVGKTVIHEIGHYFGLDDDRLYEMGY